MQQNDNRPGGGILPDRYITRFPRNIAEINRGREDSEPVSGAEQKASDFITEIYLEYKGKKSGSIKTRDQRRRERMRRNQSSQPFGKGREPKRLSAVFANTITERGWREGFEQAQVVVEWVNIVGPVNAAHTRVLGISHSTLQVQCDSSTWTTELLRLRKHIVTKINERFPGANIRDIKIYAPGVPSWKHGIRSVPGRGQRDTYG